MICPEGHALPHETEAGQCTPMYCAEPPSSAPPPEASAIVPYEDRPKGKTDLSGNNEEQFVQKALVREAVRNKHLKVPKDLKGAAADAYVDSKMTELSVHATAVMEEALRFGPSLDTRMRAAKEVLAATGHGPREPGGRVGALIIIQANGEQSTLPPWKRAKVTVVDAPTVTVAPKEPDKDA